jgi:endonuclease YncB( thermonuclease family)
MLRCLRPSLIAAAGTLALTTPGVAEGAWKGPCVRGQAKPICVFWKGKVTFVADGDTIAVDVHGDGTATPIRVRMTGINAMEQSTYARNPANRRGDCHSLEATARLERLINRARRVVRLGAQNPESMSGRRYRRSVAVRQNGAWRDLGRVLIAEGHALWLPNRNEWAHNERYNRGAQRAAAGGRRLWNTTYCGFGPSQGTKLRLLVNWDADGRDGPGNLNGEWVKIKNLGTADMPIGRWWLRDAVLTRYTFPSKVVVPAGGSITVLVGSRPSGDTNTTTHFYWERGGAVFENANPLNGAGDGGYLFDPQGDLRAWMTYPCRYRCSDPLQGKVAVTARASSSEEIRIRNTSSEPIDLEDYVVDNDPWKYTFGGGTPIAPGATLRLFVGGSPARDTSLAKYWGKTKSILNDNGDRVLLRTQTDIRIACYAWGSSSC